MSHPFSIPLDTEDQNQHIPLPYKNRNIKTSRLPSPLQRSGGSDKARDTAARDTTADTSADTTAADTTAERSSEASGDPPDRSSDMSDSALPTA